jgi:hypothetical protein
MLCVITIVIRLQETRLFSLTVCVRTSNKFLLDSCDVSMRDGVHLVETCQTSLCVCWCV